jgi:hypothetical protein
VKIGFVPEETERFSYRISELISLGGELFISAKILHICFKDNAGIQNF